MNTKTQTNVRTYIGKSHSMCKPWSTTSRMPRNWQGPGNGQQSTRRASEDAGLAGSQYKKDLLRDVLLHRTPNCGNVVLNGFVGAVFADSTICDAFYERFLDRSAVLVLAVDLAIKAMERAKCDPRLMKDEKPVAAIAALFWQLGIYLQCLETEGRAVHMAPEIKQADEVQLQSMTRNAALYHALRSLRGSAPDLAALLCAVFDLKGVEAECPVNVNQVALVRAAVTRAHSV